MSQEETILNQRYRILNQIGQGGNGITYVAEDLETGEKVALKALSLQQLENWKQVELFAREAKILQQLDHPAIPQYLDYFQIETESDCYFYIVQQLAPGKSLATLVEAGWQPDEVTVKHIAQQVLEILIYLQLQLPPVIHRDIKPQNLIYCPPKDKTSPKGKIYLVDFGSVKDTYCHTVTKTTVVGTYGYMAPEQFRGKATLATDLYGLGATLLFLLTGESPAELTEHKLKIDFRSSVNVSAKFADWIEQLIEPSISQRFPDAKTALDVLQGKQSLQPKPPFYTSINLTKTEEKLIIESPPAILSQRYNQLAAYLGLMWRILWGTIILIIISLFYLSRWALTSVSEVIMAMILWSVTFIEVVDYFTCGCLDKFLSKFFFKRRGASHFGKSITQSNDRPRVSVPLKTANVQKWDAPKRRSFIKGDSSLYALINWYSIIILWLIGGPGGLSNLVPLIIIPVYFVATLPLNKITKTIVKDWLCKVQVEIEATQIVIKRFLFNRLIEYQKFYNPSADIKFLKWIPFGEKKFGLLLTSKERAWLIEEIKQFNSKDIW